MFYDKDHPAHFSSSLGVLYTLDDAVVGQFEAECRKVGIAAATVIKNGTIVTADLTYERTC